MGLVEERLQQTVQRCFGHDARLGGTIGTVAQPGAIEIVVGRQTVASGPTFQTALVNASRQLATAAHAGCPARARGTR